MKKRFLVLIDYSDYSNSLIGFAAKLAEEQNAQLIFIHQVSTQSPAFTETDSKKSFRQSIIDEETIRLNTYLKSQLPTSKNIVCHISDKPLHISVSEFLEDSYEHLIFAGIKGTGFLKQIFIGSEVVKLVDAVDEVVVALPKTEVGLPISRVHVAVNAEYPINIPAFIRLLKTVDNPNLKLNFIHFAEKSSEDLKSKRYFKDLELLFGKDYSIEFNIYVGLKPMEELKNLSLNNTNDFVVVQKGSRYLSDQIFRKYFINELIYEGSIPLVILP